MIEGEKAKVARRSSEGAGGLASGRRRAAVEMVTRYEHALKRTARRYSLDAEDVEDAFQRALEIVLTKAPTTDPQELIRWTQTVIKHEALAVRRNRERLLGVAPGAEGGAAPHDPVALLPARSDGPEERAERREDVARTREALQTLKPAELRALTLLAEGYSYVEIAEITGFSLTKINRCLSEGRERFRTVLCSSANGERCRQLRPLISAFCDGEASPSDAAVVREHLRACAHCRATLRTYRTAPRLAAALVPALPLPRPLLARGRELFSGLGSRIATAKQLALCLGAAGGAAAGLATGVLPTPIGVGENAAIAPTLQRPARPETTAQPKRRSTRAASRRKPKAERAREPLTTPAGEPSTEVEQTEAVEYEAPPPEASPPEPAVPEPSASGGSAAGEFGP